jgi:hypothetical protein
VQEGEVTEFTSYHEPVVLVNNRGARDVTWAELVAFLEADDTDSYRYVEVNIARGSFSGRPPVAGTR